MVALGTQAEIPVVKDGENELPVPTAWRPVFRSIVGAFVKKDYHLASGVPGVLPISPDSAKQIEDYVREYGETLIELPEETWDTSVYIRMDDRWDVLVDLWTEGEGASDLVLSARVQESATGFVFNVYMVYVP